MQHLLQLLLKFYVSTHVITHLVKKIMLTSHRLWFFICIIVSSTFCLAEQQHQHVVDHHDSVSIDPELTLSEFIDITLENYPDASIIPALQQEVNALKQQGNSWSAGALTASMYYRDDLVSDDTGNREIEGAVEVPLWHWGQKEIGQRLAEQTEITNELKTKVIKWQVAGLVRSALWHLTLEKQRYLQAVKSYEVTEKLQATIKRRVDLGDLPRADFLLAKSEVLQKKSVLIHSEAEMMHGRKRLSTLTELHRIPADIQEKQSSLTDFSTHPALNVANALIERKRRQLEWIKSKGSGQSSFALGGKSERGSRDERDVESMTFSLSVPFGGDAHLAPEIANSNLEFSQSVIQRNQLFRTLEQTLHEAKHDLKVDRAQLDIANELKSIATSHLKMARLSFDSGETNLMDFLKVQTRTQEAIQNASEKNIILQRDIALYNQAVGVLP